MDEENYRKMKNKPAGYEVHAQRYRNKEQLILQQQQGSINQSIDRSFKLSKKYGALIYSEIGI